MHDEYGFAPPDRCEWCGYVAFAIVVAIWIATWVVMMMPLEDLI